MDISCLFIAFGLSMTQWNDWWMVDYGDVWVVLITYALSSPMYGVCHSRISCRSELLLVLLLDKSCNAAATGLHLSYYAVDQYCLYVAEKNREILFLFFFLMLSIIVMWTNPFFDESF